MNQRYTLKIETKRFSSARTGKKIAQIARIEAIYYWLGGVKCGICLFFRATRIPR